MKKQFIEVTSKNDPDLIRVLNVDHIVLAEFKEVNGVDVATVQTIDGGIFHTEELFEFELTTNLVLLPDAGKDYYLYKLITQPQDKEAPRSGMAIGKIDGDIAAYLIPIAFPGCYGVFADTSNLVVFVEPHSMSSTLIDIDEIAQYPERSIKRAHYFLGTALYRDQTAAKESLIQINKGISTIERLLLALQEAHHEANRIDLARVEGDLSDIEEL